MFMFRKWIFLGLMIMLGSVLVMLVVQGRREEAKQAKGPTEKVMTAKSTSTRVIAPKDLDLAGSKVEISAPATGKGKNSERSALCRIVIRNRGRISYRDVMLKLTCVGSGGKILESRTQLVPSTIPPGQEVTVPEVAIDNLPQGTVRCGLSILYSDIGAAPSH